MKKKNWITKIRNRGVKPTGKNNASVKPPEKTDDRMPAGDRVRMVISPILIPAMVEVSRPRMVEPFGVEFQISHRPKKLEDQSDESEFRALHVAADHSGCGWWRLHEIEDIINYSKKGVVVNTGLVFPREFFLSVKFDVIRLQRQLGDIRYKYWKSVKEMFKETGTNTRLVYEIDDLVTANGLPDYNEAKKSFSTDEVQRSLHDMLDVVDEFFVVSPYMRSMYRRHHQSVDISVLPNFSSRGWFDGYFDLDRRMKAFDVHKKRPRVLISGGATHSNIGDFALYSKNDYTNVVDAIISARKDFEFVFMGTQPNAFRSFFENGDMVYVPWAPLYIYPQVLNSLDIQCSVAPLAVNDFNRSKSSIKWQEACYEGFGFAGQDIEPYSDARHRFKVGSELIDLLKDMTKDEQTYQEEIEYNRKQADRYWIDDKIDDIITIYKTPYGDERRRGIKWFVDLNPAQFGVPKK